MTTGMASRLIFHSFFLFAIKIWDLLASFSIIHIPECVALLLDSVTAPPYGHIFLSVSGQQCLTQKISFPAVLKQLSIHFLVLFSLFLACFSFPTFQFSSLFLSVSNLSSANPENSNS